ncbi:VC0807 family protein [Amycolatopsis sp. RTGN1]|uniref:VC0807 family protein n=1 Tax=Amycolatopsis ponsaeliensis TaxID=2992142 RepID=UPI002550F714|nr:VC0807 family protein [Amycolatopsis sp. RTGN1]
MRALLPVVLDLALPIGGYFLLHSGFGLSAFWSLTIAGAATGLHALVTTLRRGKVDALGVLIFLEMGLSAALLIVSGDPRIVLAKPALYLAVAAVYALVTCFTGRPLVLDSGKPFATRGDPALADAYERAWTHSDRFRRTVRGVTAVWAGAFALDAVFRVVVVYSLPPERVDESVWLSQVPLVVVFVLAVVVTRLRMRPMRPVIEAHRVAAG